MDVQEIQAVVLNILAFELVLITLQPSLDDGAFPLRQRLFADFRGCTFYGRDVFFPQGTCMVTVFEASLGSFTLPFQFNRMWTASYYPTNLVPRAAPKPG